MIITKSENVAFKNEFAARMAASRKYATYKIIPHPELEGFAIETDGIEKEIKPRKKKSQENIPAQSLGSTSNSAPVKKHRATTPWKPAPLIDVPDKYKNPDFKYRFVKSDRPGNIQKKISEHWEIDTEIAMKIGEDHPELLVPTVNDGKQLGNSLQIREMTLMRIPKELAESRAEYYEEKNVAAQRSAEEIYKNQNKSTYGKVSIGKN